VRWRDAHIVRVRVCVRVFFFFFPKKVRPLNPKPKKMGFSKKAVFAWKHANSKNRKKKKRAQTHR
jgi:hypothetical protein